MSELLITPLDLTNDEELELKVKWANDEEINHLFTPNLLEGKLPVQSKQMIVDSIKTQPKDYCHHFMIRFGDTYIGEASIMVEPDYLIKKEEGTGWLAIIIGEKEYWGHGLGSKILSFLEAEAKELGLKRCELGVFEFNEIAYKSYVKAGFKPFAEVEDFTFYNGKWYKDIRLELYLD
jgi:RimJ/RimL family protein N-acetyltransferase